MPLRRGGRGYHCCCWQRLVFISAIGDATLDCRALFVVVPSLDHNKWRMLVGRKFLFAGIEGIRKGLAAAGGDVPIQPPRCFAVVEGGPCTADDELVGIL